MLHAAAGGKAMTSDALDTVQLSSSEHQVQLRRAVIAATVGTAIEWYDFFLYSTHYRTGFCQAVLSTFGSLGRHPGGFCHLCCRLRGAAHRSRDFRALWCPARPA